MIYIHSHLWLYFIFLFFVVIIRAQIFYWLGRSGAKIISRTTQNKTGFAGWINRFIKRAEIQEGVDAIDKWGLLIIPLSFLTIGFQTFVNTGAGVMRLRWIIYTLAALPGYIIWALFYAYLNAAIIGTALKAKDGSRPALFIITILVVSLTMFFLLRRHMRIRDKENKQTVKTIA